MDCSFIRACKGWDGTYHPPVPWRSFCMERCVICQGTGTGYCADTIVVLARRAEKILMVGERMVSWLPY